MVHFFREHWTAILGALLILVGLGLVLHFHPETLATKLLLGFIVEIGFALIIAWGVGLTVERRAKLEYNQYIQEKERSISQNVFQYLYNVNLPREVFDVFADFVLKEPIIKTTQTLDFELLDPIEGSDWINMRCSFDYILKNVSGAEVKHLVKFHTSKVSGMNEPDNRDIGLQSLIIGGKPIPPERFPEIDEAADDDVGQQKFQEPVTIQPGQEVRVIVTFLQHKRIDDSDLFQSNSVCLKSDFRIRYNPKVFNLFLEPIHPSNSFAAEPLKPQNGDNCTRATFSVPILPKNGIFFWWSKKPSNN